MPHLPKRSNWRAVATQSLDNQWPDVKMGERMCWSRQKSNTLCIEIGQDTKDNVGSCVILLKDDVSDATRGLLATDHVILNHGQVTWTTPELAPPLLTTTPHQREDVSALDRFNVHRCPTRRVFSGTGLEPVTKQATVRYLYHSATAASLKMGIEGIDYGTAGA
ncbi:uncharacterized protein TNCV_4641452 [Trichonephila clavipes]|nr:uncharacterized protein TNCV_4641452 [Trichonephila clavipes]